MHGFFGEQLQKDTNINTNKNETKTINKDTTLHFEGLLIALHCQELSKKFLINKQNKINGEQASCDKKH